MNDHHHTHIVITLKYTITSLIDSPLINLLDTEF